MSARDIKIGVMGAGAIGCYLGGRLIASGAQVVLVGRASLAQEVAKHGMGITDYRGADLKLLPAQVNLVESADALADCDVVLLTVKSGDTEASARLLASVLRPGTPVVSFQNGVGNPDVLRAAGLNVVAGMVPFNVLRREGAHFHQGTSGKLVVDSNGAPAALIAAFRKAGLAIQTRADVRDVQWGKLIVNLNNSINALAGLPIKEQLAQRGYRLVMAAAVREATSVLAAAKIAAKLQPPVPLALLPALLSLPDALFRLPMYFMIRVDPQARSSMWDDLSRGRRTQIDALNGEIVALAERAGRDAPVNRAIVDLVKRAEGHGSPGLSADALHAQLLRE